MPLDLAAVTFLDAVGIAALLAGRSQASVLHRLAVLRRRRVGEDE